MTPEEQLKKNALDFTEELKKLQEKYGVVIIPDIQPTFKIVPKPVVPKKD